MEERQRAYTESALASKITRQPAQCWKKEIFVKLQDRYKHLIAFLANNPYLGRSIANEVKPSECEGMANLIFAACESVERRLQYYRELLIAELQFAGHDPTSMLRERSRLPSRFTTIFLGAYAHKHLRSVIEKKVTEIAKNRMMTLEVDPDKRPRTMEKNRAALLKYAQEFLDLIIDEKTLAQMPRPVRAIAWCVLQMSQQLPEEFRVPLIGNLIILRLFCPAMAVPDFYGMIDPEICIFDRPRRNLVLITKLLQNLSNGVEFGGKEDYMDFANPFIKENAPRMKEYLEKVVFDTEQKEDSTPFADLLDPGSLSPRTPESVDMSEYRLRGLATCHSALRNNKEPLVTALSAKQADIESDSVSEIDTRLKELMILLGQVPPIGKAPWYNPQEPKVKEYAVVKTNYRGKRQDRIIKFTVNSLLNIQHSKDSASVRNEKLVTEIDEIIAPEDRPTLRLHFTGKDMPKNVGYFPSRSSSKMDKLVRNYEMPNLQLRDEVIGELFEMCFSHHSNEKPVAFAVEKVNRHNKKQSRVFKMTKDSFLNMNGSKVQKEIHFATVESARVDDSEKNVVWLTINEEEPFPRKNMLKTPEEAQALVAALNEGIDRYEDFKKNPL